MNFAASIRKSVLATLAVCLILVAVGAIPVAA
jgi:hypothetical protein